MTPLTKDQAAALDAMAASAMHSVEEAVGVANEAGHLAERLRAHGINASVTATLTRCWAHIWVTVRPTTHARLVEVLGRLDLVVDEARSREQACGWHDVYLQGIGAPLFVLLDTTPAEVPA